jgi:hypothetical protein
MMEQEFCIDQVSVGGVLLVSSLSSLSLCLSRFCHPKDPRAESSSAALKCRSACERDDHLEIILTLGTSTVEGWVGSYFTVHPYNPSTHETTTFDYAGRNTPLLGGTLEWGSQAERTLCLPSRAECYEVSEQPQSRDSFSSFSFVLHFLSSVRLVE